MGVLSTAGLARLSARRPWRTLGLWVLLIVMAVALMGSLPNPLTGEDSFTSDTESVVGADLLEERLRGTTPTTETVVITSEVLTVDDPAYARVVEQTTAALRGMTGVVASVENYYEARQHDAVGAEQLVSDDRRTTIVPVTLAGVYEDLATHGAAYVDVIAAQGSADVEVLTVGDLSGGAVYGEIAERDLMRAEIVGLPVALLILVVVFGALVAAGVPLLVAIVSIVVTLGLTTIVGQAYALSDVVTNIITMIGLAVGIDYALFIVERYREERRRGVEKREAIAIAGGTAARAVVFSGLTVVIALLGMFIIPVNVFKSLAAGAALVVLVSVAASLTLIPALLALLGDRIDWPRRRRYDDPRTLARQRHLDARTVHAGFWGRITRVVMARPIVSAVVAGGLLLTIAMPYLDLRTGEVGIDTLPESDVKRAFTILDEEFYAGVIAPVEIVVDGNTNNPAVTAGIDRLVTALARDEHFGPAEIETNAAGDLTLVSAPLDVDAASAEAATAIDRLRETTIPAAFAGTDVEVYVTGHAAFNHDFETLMSDVTPRVFAFVLGLSFLLLLLAFRSLVVPAKAILMNLLSVAAAYGLLVLVFQKGIGNELFGFTEAPVIETWVPIFLFCILFGLSMDYHVFLLSRIREHYDRTGENREAVAVGLHATAKIITGAALIMVAVFGAFAAGSLVEMQQMGFGLATAILIDATIVRSILVPAGMALLGTANWYLPRWLHWLPDLRVEGARRVAAPTAAPAGDD